MNEHVTYMNEHVTNMNEHVTYMNEHVTLVLHKFWSYFSSSHNSRHDQGVIISRIIIMTKTRYNITSSMSYIFNIVLKSIVYCS